jgi:superfamily I DNA and/or RNA helicase
VLFLLISGYVGQLLQIRNLLSSEFVVVLSENDESILAKEEEGVGLLPTVENANLKRVRVATVDSYQGEESLFVIVSLVRSSGQSIGFLKSPNRINVLLSRAKHGMAIFGNKAMLEKSGVEMWRGVLNMLEKENAIFKGVPLICPR